MKETKEKKDGKGYCCYLVVRHFKKLAWALGIAILVAGYLIVISEQISNYNSTKNVELSAVLDYNDVLRNSRDYYQRRMDSSFLNQNDEKYIDLAVPEEFDFTSVASQLTSLAQAYNFRVASISVDKSNDSSSSDLKKIDISLEVAGGGYESLKGLLAGIESSLMFFDVRSISFGQNGFYGLEITSYYSQ